MKENLKYLLYSISVNWGRYILLGGLVVIVFFLGYCTR